VEASNSQNLDYNSFRLNDKFRVSKEKLSDYSDKLTLHKKCAEKKSSPSFMSPDREYFSSKDKVKHSNLNPKIFKRVLTAVNISV
jgi:hypothetical protein